MKLLRHETAHALDNAFNLRKKKRRQTLFGLSKTPYPTSYVPDPKSKSFIRNLDEFYGQSHPDEDWAETFSIWLSPNSNWRQKYKGWSAIEKITYVDSIFTELKFVEPKYKTLNKIDCISLERRTLNEYLIEKRNEVQYYHKPIVLKNKDSIASFVAKNPIESKRAVQKITKNTFITTKVLKVIAKECQSYDDTTPYSNEDAQKNLLALTKKMIKSGRHKVIM
jgi:hypothetical protein